MCVCVCVRVRVRARARVIGLTAYSELWPFWRTSLLALHTLEKKSPSYKLRNKFSFIDELHIMLVMVGDNITCISVTCFLLYL
jgi:hypothetical protein